MIMDDEATPPTTTEEEKTTVATKKRASKPKKKKAVKKTAKKVKTAKAKRGNGRLAMDEDRKDKIAASLRIRPNHWRGKVVEHLAKQNGKLTSADALAKLSGQERRTIQHFVMFRIPYKAKLYGLKYEVLNDREGNYGLKV